MSATDIMELTALRGEVCGPGDGGPHEYRDAVTLRRLVQTSADKQRRYELLLLARGLGMYADLLALTAAPDLSLLLGARGVVHNDGDALSQADRAGYQYHYTYKG